MWFELLIVLLLSLALSLGATRFMISCAPRLGLMDQPGERRIHGTAIPRAGGIAVWIAFLAVMALSLRFGWINENVFISWRWLAAFAAGSSVLVATGIVDDRRGLPPLVKLAAHALAPAVFFAIEPVRTGLFPASWQWIGDFVVFIAWSVVLINAFNLIDGLDGLCGGLAAVACFALAGLGLSNGRSEAALVLIVMGGAILGFLRYNINPARIFLGDAGSMMLGFFIATAATEAVGRKAVVGVLMLPIAVAGVPLLDVLLALWRRGMRRVGNRLHGEARGGGLFAPDRDHLHHRLLDTSGSQRKVAMILQGVAIVLSVVAFLPMLFGDRVLGLSLVGIVIIGLVGLRHLARVEIEQTGRVIHMAIKVPARRRRVAIALFAYDLIIMILAGAIAVLIETNNLTTAGSLSELSQFLVVFTILGALATLVARVHLRLWVRATMRDLVSLQFWLLVAALGAFVLFSLSNSSLEWRSLRMALIAYVFATALVTTPRVLLDLFRDFGLEARHRNPDSMLGGDIGPVVVLGAGDMGCLLLDHLKSSSHTHYPGLRLLGFLDEVEMLHGRRLRSFRILGGLEKIPELVASKGLRGIVLAIGRPNSDLMERLNTLAAENGLRIYRWSVGIAPLVEETPH